MGLCTLEIHLVLLVLLGLVGESKFERLPYVEIGHVGVVFWVVVDLATKLLLLLPSWDTSVGYIALDGSVRFAVIGYRLQEGRTSRSWSNIPESVFSMHVVRIGDCSPSQNEHHLAILDHTREVVDKCLHLLMSAQLQRRDEARDDTVKVRPESTQYCVG